jgi:serine/threonine protein kinase/tetratricopeptide (TPR) repeat protein
VEGKLLGPYRILSELGSGGMGKVYLARRSADLSRGSADLSRRSADLSGRSAEGAKAEGAKAEGAKAGRVALKIVHPHLLETEGFLQRFLREAELGRKVDHGNVVRTLAVATAEHEGRQIHYMVMEYVEGRSLRQLLRDLGTVPETFLREITAQVADGLAAIHAAGIVHRDLKPENVLITDDQHVRIMDLGVAKLQEASVALTSAGHFVGSLLYAAPEQFRSQKGAPPADLYSLGVMLYELATGDNPFRRDDPAGCIQAQLRFEARPAAEANPEVSAFFSEVVGTLLAKHPDERFASAEQLRSVIDDGERSAWWATRQKALREHRPALQVSRETAVHGRERELKLLADAWEQACQGPGGTVFIHGEAGLGKTRLIDEFLHRLDGGDAHILYGSYSPSGGLGGLSASILEQFGAAGLEESLRPYLGPTPRLVPAFSALIKHESPPPDAESLGGDALHALICHLMKALADEKPTLWIVEDIHNAAEESRKLVLSLARAVGSHRALLLITTRPGLPEDELAHFSRLPHFRRADLGRLSPREVIELLRDAFKSDALAEKLGGNIAYKSDGVPFFVFEMLRGLKSGLFLKQLTDGSYVQTEVIGEIEVPSAVRDIIAARLSSLSDEDRDLLDVASVQGFEFESDLVAKVCGAPRIQVLRRLAALERRSGVVRSAGRVYRFDHHQIQEILYTCLPQELREAYHTMLAEAFAARAGEDTSGEAAVFLASHHLQGSQPERALDYLDPALDHLERSYRSGAALKMVNRALEVPDLLAGERRVKILLRKFDRQDLLGRWDEQEAVLAEAAALADESGDLGLRSRAQRAWGIHLTQIAAYEEARARFAKAGELARAAGDRAQEANAERNLGTVCHRLGRIEEARRHFEDSLALAREIGDREGETKSTGNLGIVFVRLGRRGEARGYFERALELSRERGDRQGEAAIIGNLGVIYLDRGRYAEGRECFARKLTLSREIGYRKGEVAAMGALGTVLADFGRFAEARKQLEHYLALSTEMGDRLEQGYALARLGEVAEGEGDLEKAEQFHGEALALRRDVGYTGGVGQSLLTLGRLRAQRGDEESARSHFDEALALGRNMGEPSFVLLATAHRTLLPGGDVDAALAALEDEMHVGHKYRLRARFLLWRATRDLVHLEEAHRLLVHLRDHAPEDYRDSMLQNVPLHRDIMQAWEEHAGR